MVRKNKSASKVNASANRQRHKEEAAPEERSPAEEEELVYEVVAREELHGNAEGQESPPECWDVGDEEEQELTKEQHRPLDHDAPVVGQEQVNVGNEYDAFQEDVLRLEEEREEVARLLGKNLGEDSGTDEEEDRAEVERLLSKNLEEESEEEEVVEVTKEEKEVMAGIDINDNLAESECPMDLEVPSYEGNHKSMLPAEKTVCPTNVKVTSASNEGTGTSAESPENASAVEGGRGRGPAAARPTAPPAAHFQSTDVRNKGPDSSLVASNYEKSLRASLVVLGDRGHVSNHTFGQLQRARYLSPACNEPGVIVRYKGHQGGGGRLTLGEGAGLPFSTKGHKAFTIGLNEAASLKSQNSRLSRPPRPAVAPQEATSGARPSPQSQGVKLSPYQIPKVEKPAAKRETISKPRAARSHDMPPPKPAQAAAAALAPLPRQSMQPPGSVPRPGRAAGGDEAHQGHQGHSHNGRATGRAPQQQQVNTAAGGSTKRGRSTSSNAPGVQSGTTCKKPKPQYGFGTQKELQKRHQASSVKSPTEDRVVSAPPPAPLERGDETCPPRGKLMELLHVPLEGDGIAGYNSADGQAAKQGEPFSSDFLQRSAHGQHSACVQCPPGRGPCLGERPQHVLMISDCPRTAHFWEGISPFQEGGTFSSFLHSRAIQWEHVEVLYLPRGLWADMMGPVRAHLAGREGIFHVLLAVGGSAVGAGITKERLALRLVGLANEIRAIRVRWGGVDVEEEVAIHSVSPVQIHITKDHMVVPPHARALMTSNGTLGQVVERVVEGNTLRYVNPVNSEVRKAWRETIPLYSFPPDLEKLAMHIKSCLVDMGGVEERLTVMAWTTETFLDGSEDLATGDLWEYMLRLAHYVKTKRWDMPMQNRMTQHLP